MAIPERKKAVAQAMLAEGFSNPSICQTVGISRSTVDKLKRQELILSEQAEKIRRGLRNRFARIADKALDQISDKKLSEASAKDLMYVAVKAADVAKLAEPSITETYTKSMERFLLQDGEERVTVTEQHTVTVKREAEPAVGEGVGAPHGVGDASA